MPEFIIDSDENSKVDDGYNKWLNEFNKLMTRKARFILTPKIYRKQYEAKIDEAVALGYFTPQHASEVKEWFREGFETQIRKLIHLKKKQQSKDSDSNDKL